LKQRGYAQAMLYLGAVGIIMALAIAAYNVVDHRGYTRGVSETDSKYAKRDNDALRSANARIQELEEKARAGERRRAEELAAVSVHYQGALEAAKSQRERDVALAHAGTLRLRDPNAASPAGCDRGGPGEAAAAAAGRDGAQAGELSREAVGFLLNLADEADEVVEQLTACQAVVRTDRRM
jgi:prophage endopeptidase